MNKILARFKRYIVYLGCISFLLDILMLTPTLFMINVFDKVLSSRSNVTLLVLGGLALYALLVQGVLDALRSRLFMRFGVTLQKMLAPPILETSLQGLKQSELTQHGLDDVNEIKSFLTGSGIKAFFEVPWIPVFWVVLYLFHPALAAVALIISLLLFALTVAEDRLTSADHKRAVELGRRASNFAILARQNAEAVSSLGMQSAITARWCRSNDEHLTHSARAARRGATIHAFAKFLRVSGQMLAIAVSAYLIINTQEITPGIMVGGALIMGKAMGPIDRLIGTWKSFVNARAAHARLAKLLVEVENNASPSLRLPRPRGDLAVERVFFQTVSERRILSGINFRLNAGESLGVIGPSGSGKTSLARLMVGLYPPTQGHVRLDGADVYQWAQRDLGPYLGYLPQNVVLFPGSVAENIARMQDPEVHSEAIIEAAQQARIHELILQLPKGYNTEVGEGGAILSGGQRQLVGLARALFGNPSFVVLDEPNASLDGTAELALIEVIRDLKKRGITTVVIAHKPSLIRDVDRLLVLRGGEQKLFGRNQDVLRELNAEHAPGHPAEPLPATIPGSTAANPASVQAGP